MINNEFAIIRLLDRLASLVERMADTTPYARDKHEARQIAIDAAALVNACKIYNKETET